MSKDLSYLDSAKAAYDQLPGPQLTFSPSAVRSDASLCDCREKVEEVYRYWINFWGQDDCVDFKTAHERSMFYLGQKATFSTRVVQHNPPYDFDNVSIVTGADAHFRWGAIARQTIPLNVRRAATRQTARFLFGRNLGDSITVSANSTTFQSASSDRFDILGGPALAACDYDLVRGAAEYIRTAPLWYDDAYVELHTKEFEEYLKHYQCRLDDVGAMVRYIFSAHKDVKAVFSDIRNVSERLPYSDLFWQAKELHLRRRWIDA